MVGQEAFKSCLVPSEEGGSGGSKTTGRCRTCINVAEHHVRSPSRCRCSSRKVGVSRLEEDVEQQWKEDVQHVAHVLRSSSFQCKNSHFGASRHCFEATSGKFIFFVGQPTFKTAYISVPPATNDESSKTFVIFATATTTTATLPSRSTVLN